MGKNFRDTLNEQLKDPDFKHEWDALEEEYQSIQSSIDDTLKRKADVPFYEAQATK